MTFKKLLVLICVVTVLLVLAFAKKAIQQKQIAQEETQEKFSIYVLTKDLTASFIAKIIVYKGSEENNKLSVAKNKEGNWILERKFGIRAKKEMIDNLLKELGDLKGEIRAASGDLFGDFQIKDNQGVHIIFEADGGKVLKHLVVSFLPAGRDKNFVRLADGQEVVLVTKNILELFNLFDQESKLDETFLADLKLFSFEPKQIQKIELNTKESLVLKKSQPEGASGPAWNFEPVKVPADEIDTSKVDEFLRDISGLYARDVLDPNLNTYGFDRPALRIALEDAQAKIAAEVELGSYLEKDKLHYLRVLPANFVYKVSDASIQKINKDRQFFLKPQPVKQEKPAEDKKGKK
jgi:hypothetical protein